MPATSIAQRAGGKHGGAVGRIRLAVLHALIFDFLNFRSGQLDPSYAAIARKAIDSRRARATPRRLSAWHPQLGSTLRRKMDDGRFVLEQETNAYAVLPAEPMARLCAPPRQRRRP